MANTRYVLAMAAMVVLPAASAQADPPQATGKHFGGNHQGAGALPGATLPSRSFGHASTFIPAQNTANKVLNQQPLQGFRRNFGHLPNLPANNPNRRTAVQTNPNFGGNNGFRHHHHHHQRGNNVVVYPWLGGFGVYAGWGAPYYGWGHGYGYPLYSGGFYGGYPYYANYTTIYTTIPAGTPVAQNQVVRNQVAPNQAAPQNPGDPADAADAFIDQGEADFKAARYEAAARQWQHALVDDPQNGATMMLLAQSLFAMGKYDEAAGATQAAMQMLPEEKWGTVVENFSELYGNVQDYTNQLKALEKARDAEPNSPALRFLLGFHFGYLGYPKHAVRELDKGLNLAPGDLGAQKVRGIFAAKWPEAPPLPAAAAAAAAEFEKQMRQGAPPVAQPPAVGQPARPQPTPRTGPLGTPS